METYSGIVKSVGGPELGASGKEKPRKIVISDSPEYQGKTFRIWGNDSDFQVLEASLGKQVTVEYEPTPVSFGDKSWTSNDIKAVHQNGDGGGQENGSSDVRGSASSAPDSTTPASNHDWSVPKPAPPEVWHETKATISGKDDYWEQRSIMDQQRSLEMEAAWAVKAVIDREGPNAANLPHEKLVDEAISLAVLKRRVASELSE